MIVASLSAVAAPRLTQAPQAPHPQTRSEPAAAAPNSSIAPEVSAGRVSIGGSSVSPTAIYDDPRVAARQKLDKALAAQEQQQVLEVQALAQRDREVRAHEQAHAAVGGQYAGAASYDTVRGPDGISYAVAGEVPISTGAEATPEQTLRKAQIVRRAALAPAEPSGQDRQVAAMARTMEINAQMEIARQQSEEQASVVKTALSSVAPSGAFVPSDPQNTEAAPPSPKQQKAHAAYGAAIDQAASIRQRG